VGANSSLALRNSEHLQFPLTSFILAICAYKSGRCLIFKFYNFLLQLVVLTKLHLQLIAGTDLKAGSEDAVYYFRKANFQGMLEEREETAHIKMEVMF